MKPKALTSSSNTAEPTVVKRHIKGLIKASFMCAITAILAYVTIPLPFSPVPITLQSLGVMLAGLVLGPSLGGWAMLVYLALGLVGLPVFAGGTSGFTIITGPTGGYILGFLPGAWLTGALSQSILKTTMKNTKPGPFAAHLISSLVGGIGVVHLLGIFHLAQSTGLSFAQAALMGTAPFLPGDIFKAVAASILASKIKST